MASSSPPSLLLLLLFSFLFTTVSSLTCTTQKLTDTSNKLYSHCLDLPVLSSFLHWTYDPSNATLSVAFVAAPPDAAGWVSWGLNPTGTGMQGAQVLAAYKTNGVVTVKTLDLKSYSAIIPGKLSFEVWDVKGEDVDGVMRIFAKIKVPGKVETLNHVWQVGKAVSDGGILEKHDFAIGNLNSKGTLSLNGATTSSSEEGPVDSKTQKKNIHGILNTVSWGVLFPLGVIIARYMRTFPSADPAWFYLHVGCQLSAYVIGVAGWGTGMKLGSQSEGVEYSGHRNIGIALFCLATIQIFALFIRPKKDHKYRYIWNIYHHSFGYTIVILGIINIFRGFGILQPDEKWKSTYIIVIIALAVVAILLEVITWIVVLRRKSNKSTKPYDGFNNGPNGQQPLNI